MARTTTQAAGVTITGDLPDHEVIEGHHAPADIYLDEGVAGVAMKIAAVDASELVGKPLADLHRHSVDEIYLVVSPGLRFEVQTDEGSVMVTSPASVRVPANKPHRFVVHDAAVSPCVFLGILVGQAPE